MVTLPPPFVATPYPGYFWHLEKQSLFSLKVGGELREMSKIPQSYWVPEACYQISHKGVRHIMTVPFLKTLKLTDSEIPIVERPIPEKDKNVPYTGDIKRIVWRGSRRNSGARSYAVSI